MLHFENDNAPCIAGLVLEQPAELGPSITTQILDHHEDDEEGDLIIDDDLVDLDSYHEELDIGYDDEEDHEHEHDLEHDLEPEQVVILEAVELQEQEKKPQERHQEEEEDEEEEEEDEEDDEDEEVSLEGDNIDLVYHDELTGLRPVSVVKPEISMIVKDPRESGLITLADGRHVFPAEHLKKVSLFHTPNRVVHRSRHGPWKGLERGLLLRQSDSSDN